MSKNLLVVFGATGNQGGSIIRHVLNDAELSSRYTIRAITRDTTSPKARALLSQGVEVVPASFDDPKSLATALHGASFVFALTATTYDGNTHETETRQAKSLIDTAVAQGATYIIWSSMSHPYKISNGTLTHVAHFDVKAEIETYIRSKPVKSAHIAPGSFMQNYVNFLRPQASPEDDGTFVMNSILAPSTLLPLIDIEDMGAWVAAVLASPEEYDGKFFAAAERLYSQTEVCELMSKVSGKTVRHNQVPDEVYKGFLPEPTRDMLFEMYVLFREYGYYGEGMEGQVEWAREQARGKLVGLEEFLRGRWTVE